MNDLRIQLLELIHSRDLSAYRAADICRTTTGYMSQVLSGKKTPSLGLLQDWVKSLGGEITIKPKSDGK